MDSTTFKNRKFSGRLSAVTCKRAAVPRPFHLSIPSCLACFRSHQRTPFCLRQLITSHSHFKPQSPDIPRNSFEHTIQFPLIFLISRCMDFLKSLLLTRKFARCRLLVGGRAYCSLLCWFPIFETVIPSTNCAMRNTRLCKHICQMYINFNEVVSKSELLEM